MVNEDILTGLKNALERGESLENAIHILSNSGYNSSEIKEAASYFKKGNLEELSLKPEEHLAMPEEKSFFKKLFHKKEQKILPTKIPNKNPKPLLPVFPRTQRTRPLSPDSLSIVAKSNKQEPNQAPISNNPEDLSTTFKQKPVISIKSNSSNPAKTKPKEIKKSDLSNFKNSPLKPLKYSQKQNSPAPIQVTELKPRTSQSPGPRKPSRFIEIILVIFLLILIGLLLATILYKDTLLSSFT